LLCRLVGKQYFRKEKSMRVQISYTVDEESVLKEVAKIINLSAEDMQQVVTSFNEVQEALTNTNAGKSLQIIDKFRAALFNVDTRLFEVAEIVNGFEEYRKNGGDDGTDRVAKEPSQ